MDKKMQELVQKVAEETGLSPEEIKIKIKAKQSELSGLVSEEGAAYIVANELGVKTRNRIIESKIKIKDIMPEMRSVTVPGRVQRIIGPREFTTKKGLKSKVANLDIIDDTGTTRIVLWNMSDIEKIEKGEVKIGDIIQVRNGYVREGFRGGLEVNLGNKGVLVTDPEGVDEKEFPEAKTGDMKLAELKPGSDVNVVGRVTHNFGINEFERNGNKGKVANIIINDGTSSAKLVLWNEQADIVPDLKEGDILKVENAYTKEGLRGVEVQANQRTKVEKNPKGVKLPEPGKMENQRVSISELKEGDTYKEIRGVVVDVYGDNFVYDMCPNCRKKVEGDCQKCGAVTPDKLLVVNTMIDDGSGTIRASFFRDAAEKLVGSKTSDVEGDGEKVKAAVGKEVIVEGRVKRNEMMDRLEFNAFNVKDANPVEEAGKLIEEMSKGSG